MFTEKDYYFMQQALRLAQLAAVNNEIPVGAVLVYNNEIIGQGFNQSIQQQDPTAHAEMLALRQAAEKIANYRLINTSLYVTLEPCMMCAGALIHSRIKHLIYGTQDPKAGAIQSQAKLLDQLFLNHRITYQGGLMYEECGIILSNFFKMRREEIKKDKTGFGKNINT